MSTPLRALLIDDSEEDTELLLRHLRRNGFDVLPLADLRREIGRR